MLRAGVRNGSLTFNNIRTLEDFALRFYPSVGYRFDEFLQLGP